MGVGEDDPEGLGDRLDVGTATHVEEVGRLAAVVLHEVHGAHRQAGAVDEAADRAVELDVGEPRGGGPRLRGILFRLVAERRDRLVAKERVVVERHLRVESDEAAVLREHERIDFDERGVEVDERPAERAEERLGMPPAGGGQAQLGGEHAGLVGTQPAVGVERLREDQLRGLRGHLLDVHAAGGARDQHRRTDTAVDEHGAVELAVDGAAALHEHLADDLPLGTGLDRHERVAEQSGGDPPGVVGRLRQFHAPLLGAPHLPLAPAAGMDLCLDGADGRAEGGEGRGRLVGGAGDGAGEHRHTGGSQEVLGLELMNLHRVGSRTGGSARTSPQLSHEAAGPQPAWPTGPRGSEWPQRAGSIAADSARTQATGSAASSRSRWACAGWSGQARR